MPTIPETTLWIMAWEELERGWGRRPDGWSVHGSPELCEAYVEKYWAGMPKDVPDEYDRPAWDKPRKVRAPEGLAALVESVGGSVRLWDRSIKLAQDGQSIVEVEAQLLVKAEAALLERTIRSGTSVGSKPTL